MNNIFKALLPIVVICNLGSIIAKDSPLESVAHKLKDALPSKKEVKGAAHEIQDAAQKVTSKVQGSSYTEFAKSAFFAACSAGPAFTFYLLGSLMKENIGEYPVLYTATTISAIASTYVLLKEAYNHFKKATDPETKTVAHTNIQ